MTIRNPIKRKSKNQIEKIHQRKKRNKRNIKRRRSKTSSLQSLLFRLILKFKEQGRSHSLKFKKLL